MKIPNKVSRKELKVRQGLLLQDKIHYSLIKIKEFYEEYEGKIAISFSGGKESTVGINLVRTLYPNVPAIFFNTGLEFPEILRFVRTFPNVKWIRPKYSFKEVIEKYGYPVPSKEVAQQIFEIRNTNSEKLLYKRLNGADNEYKSGRLPKKWRYLIDAPFKISHKCCYFLKKSLSVRYERVTGNKMMIFELAEESKARTQKYLRYGCNSFNSKRPISRPMGFWTYEDVWKYIKDEKLPYSSIYDKGYYSTGCMFCMFGIAKDEDRFKLMEQTHPKLHDYCINKLGLKQILDYMNVKY